MNFLKLPSKLCTGDVSKSPRPIPERENFIQLRKEKDQLQEKLDDTKKWQTSNEYFHIFKILYFKMDKRKLEMYTKKKKKALY